MPVGFYSGKRRSAPVVVREYIRRLPAIPQRTDYKKRSKVKSYEMYYKRLHEKKAYPVIVKWEEYGDRAEHYEKARGGGPISLVRHPHVVVKKNPSLEEYRNNTCTLLFSSVLLIVFTIVSKMTSKK